MKNTTQASRFSRFALAGLISGMISMSAANPARADLDGPSHPNAFGVEALGRGGAYSLFFDRMATEQMAIGVGIAFGTGGAIGTTSGALTIPIYMNFYLSGADSRPFITGGATLSTGPLSLTSVSNRTGTEVYGNVGFGYEYRGPTGFLFRVTPYVFVGPTIAPWVGITFGYAF